MIVIGVDPGMNGAIVAMDITNNKIHKHIIPRISKNAPIDAHELADIFRHYHVMTCEKHVIIEEVHAMFGSAAKSTFNFGFVCGQIRQCVVTLKMRYSMVQPKTWQKSLHEGIPIIKKLKKGNKKETKDTKAMSLMVVKNLFPDIELRTPNKSGGFYKNPHDGIVDALLIAEWGRRYVI